MTADPSVQGLADVFFGQNVLYQATLEWWRSHRPAGMSTSEHMHNPTVGLESAAEKALARALVDLIYLAAQTRLVERAAGRPRS